ncbi:dihydrofolate reductase family protein [Microbacterium sp. SORGH_AS_0888]|uniref:dihydrofolate reductase family protein n=1 Tax=Microbacterium sp. SORGH_AS_0888 TaxID=3041791 RepID=UPI0027D88ABD|nr:dihydrofolate reductase family protein [Microbacterium sp. SORGH_AS_0888]
MPRVIYHTATTLDGFIATTDHSLEWLFDVPGAAEAEAAFPAFLERVGALVLGSSTYDWVYRMQDLGRRPDGWRSAYGDRPTWVFMSRELPTAASTIRFARGEVADAWPDIAASAGERDVWVMGGGDLAGQFADAGLLDEIRVSIAPATLGAGRPLLPRVLPASRLTLVSAERVGAFAELRYAVSRD